MDINRTNLTGMFEGFNVHFNKGLAQPKTHMQTVAMTTTSSGAAETYAWLGESSSIRRWIGDRLLNDLKAHRYTIVNELFERTEVIPRTAVEDDQYGIFGPRFQQMGMEVSRHPDELVFGLLGNGFVENGTDGLCYDGQPFFDTDHPVGNGAAPASVSNYQGGAGEPWFLLDCNQVLKPMIYQKRTDFEFSEMSDPEDPVVFMKDDYVYGIRGRSSAGFGLWQMAHASKADLNAANYELARTSMQTIKSDTGKPLGIMPSHLVVPPSLEAKARRLLVTLSENGGSNEWAGSAELIVTPFLA